MKQRIALIACAALIGVQALGCAPLIVGVVVAGTALVATDRRTTGTQVDDQTIQLRVANELSTAFGKQPVHINVNSFDRKVLLTGEVPDEAVKTRVGEIAAASQNVRAVVNELVIAPPSSIGDRTADTTLATKVRAAFVNTKEISFNSIEIVAERGVIYLLGLVTEQEGQIAAIVASKVSGVKQVVKVFDYASKEEIERRRALSASGATPTQPAGALPAPAAEPAPAPGATPTK
ncbi:MAG TPA: BON domain-containing protein [Burkholderiaceae bacterium]|nr:BON domain-containing protein [Burkholderiaceae bacterium]